MKIDWNVTKETKDKAEKIYKMHESGIKFQDIARKLKHGRVYIIGLNTWYKEFLRGERKIYKP